MFGVAIGLIDSGLGVLAQDELVASELGSEMKVLRSRIDLLETQYARRLEAFDAAQAFEGSGSTSTVDWLRRNTGQSGSAASRQVGFARQLPELEATKDALELGQISLEQAMEIARATEDLGVAAETELLEVAASKDPTGVREAAKEIRYREDPTKLDRIEAEHYRRRSLRFFATQNGMLGFEGALPAADGAVFRLALDSLTGIPAKGDRRTQPQRNADALIQLLSSKHRTQVVVTVASDGSQAPYMEGAGVIGDATARRLLGQGSVSVMTVDRKTGVVLDLGRSKRLCSEAQRRAVVARDRSCRVRGCNNGARQCQVHHLDPWIEGGHTRVDRMALICLRHHRTLDEGYRLAAVGDGTFDLAPP